MALLSASAIRVFDIAIRITHNGGVLALVFVVAVSSWFGSLGVSLSGSVETSAVGVGDLEFGVDGIEATPANPVVESYARDYLVSYGEAERRLDRISVLQAVMASIREVEGSRVAGWGIDHGEDFGAWVWLVGDEQPSDETAEIAAGFSDVVIRKGAVHSLEELEAAERRFAAEWARSLVGDHQGDLLGSSRVVFSSVDLEANGIEIGIDTTVPGRVRRGSGAVGDSVADSVLGSAQLSRLWTGHVGVSVKVSGARAFEQSTDVPVDTKITDILGGSTFKSCTSGFAAKQLGGDYGVVTAGHCPDNGYFHPGGPLTNWIQLPYVKGWPSKTADAQFNRIPAGIAYDLRDDYWCGENAKEVCDVTGIMKRADMLGEYVCMTGSRTKVSCGEVTNIAYRGRCHDRQWNALVCAPVFIAVEGPKLRTRGGDSGGPLYNHKGLALGVHSSGIRLEDGTLRLAFSVIEEIEIYLGVKILTEDPTPPSAPRRVDVGVESEVVWLSWTPPPEGANRYRVFRRKKSTGETFSLIGDTSASSFDHPIAELLPGTDYEYRIKAVNNLDMVGPDSEVATVSIPAVKGLTTVVGANGVSVSWTVPQGDVKGYEVYRRAAVAGEPYRKVGNSREATFIDPISGLTPGVEYYYRVKAVGSNGVTGGWGPGANYARAVVSAAGGLTAADGADGVSVSWSIPKGDVKGYEVYRRAAVAGEPYRKVGDTKKATFIDPISGLTPGVEYYYRVKAVGSNGVTGGWGPGSNYARAVIPAVKGLTVTVDTDGVALTWTVPKGDVGGYEVYRRAAMAGEPYRKTGESQQAAYVDPTSKLTPGVEYYYRVKAVGTSGVTGGWGPGSNYARAIIPAVKDLAAVVDADDVSLAWTVPQGDIVSYEVYRRAAVAGQPYRDVGDTKKATFIDPISGLTPGVEYYYRVKAISSSGLAGGWGTGSNYARAIIPRAD